jgi:hypothetical protein
MLYKYYITLRSPPNPRKRHGERRLTLPESPCKFPKLEESRRILFDQHAGNHYCSTDNRLLLLRNGDEKESTTGRIWRRSQSIRNLNGFSDSDFVVCPSDTVGEDLSVPEITCVSAEGDVFYDSIVSRTTHDDDTIYPEVPLSDEFYDCSQYDYCDPFPCRESPDGNTTDGVTAHPPHEDFAETITPVPFFTPEHNNRRAGSDPDKIDNVANSTVVQSPSTQTDNKGSLTWAQSGATTPIVGRDDSSAELVSDVQESAVHVPDQDADSAPGLHTTPSENFTGPVNREVSAGIDRLSDTVVPPTGNDTHGIGQDIEKKPVDPQSSGDFINTTPTNEADAECVGAASLESSSRASDVLNDESGEVVAENLDVNNATSLTTAVSQPVSDSTTTKDAEEEPTEANGSGFLSGLSGGAVHGLHQNAGQKSGEPRTPPGVAIVPTAEEAAEIAEESIPDIVATKEICSKVADVASGESLGSRRTELLCHTTPGDSPDDFAPKVSESAVHVLDQDADTASDLHGIPSEKSADYVNGEVSKTLGRLSDTVVVPVDSDSHARDQNIATKPGDQQPPSEIISVDDAAAETKDHADTASHTVLHDTSTNEEMDGMLHASYKSAQGTDMTSDESSGAKENIAVGDDYSTADLANMLDHAAPSFHVADQDADGTPDEAWTQSDAAMASLLGNIAPADSPNLAIEVPDDAVDTSRTVEQGSGMARHGACAQSLATETPATCNNDGSHLATSVPDSVTLSSQVPDRVADVAPAETFTQATATDTGIVGHGEESPAALAMRSEPDSAIYAPDQSVDTTTDLHKQPITPLVADVSTFNPIADTNVLSSERGAHGLDENIDTTVVDLQTPSETTDNPSNNEAKDGCSGATSIQAPDDYLISTHEAATAKDYTENQNLIHEETKQVEHPSTSSTKTDMQVGIDAKHMTDVAENQSDRQGVRLTTANHSLINHGLRRSEVAPPSAAISGLEADDGGDSIRRPANEMEASQNGLLLPRLGIDADAWQAPSTGHSDVTKEGHVSDKIPLPLRVLNSEPDPEQLDTMSPKQVDTISTPPRHPSSKIPDVPVSQSIPVVPTSTDSLDNKLNQCADMWNKWTVEKTVDDGQLESDISHVTWMSGAHDSDHDEHKMETPPLSEYSPRSNTPNCGDLLGSELYVETRGHFQPSPTPPRDWRSPSPYSTPGRATGSTSSSRAKVESSPHRIESATRRSRPNRSPSPLSFNAPVLRTSERAKQRKHRDSPSTPHRVLSSRPQFSPSSHSHGAGPSAPHTMARSTTSSRSALRTPSPSRIPTTGQKSSSSQPPESGRMTKIPTFRTPPISKLSSSGEPKSLPSQKAGNGSVSANAGSGTKQYVSRKPDLSKNLGSVERPALRKRQGNGESRSCTNAFVFNKHEAMGPCYRCWSFASAEDQQRFLARGSHLCIVRTRGGCDDNCDVFPLEEGEPAVRLCRKCFCATHASNDRLQVYRGNHVKMMPKG